MLHKNWEKMLAVFYIMVIVNSHHQGFLGEPFKIITYHRKWNKKDYLHIKQIDELKYEMQR